MDFGDIITLILFLAFIVPPFLKRKKTTKAQESGQSKPSGFSLLGKIREALKEAAREMEAQAEQARKKEASGQSNRRREPQSRSVDLTGEESVTQTFWDEIDDSKELDFYPGKPNVQVLGPIEPVHEKPRCLSTKKEPRRKAVRMSETRGSRSLTQKSFGHDAIQTSCLRSGPRRLPARSRGLQQAVVWKEILGKPVALRD
ncbi:hypothetical protein [Desulfobacter vibrioformis]|uniref:hypothetical protein n=1 Tax=Desulfobacter vibrioformis TaxID=34031 RepID=UPI0005594488|nr:hypothetical protein [Desulfobacter vibrioformis]